MFAINVEMWAETGEDDKEYCGEFLWGSEYSSGQTILFENPKDALSFLVDNKVEDTVPGFEYRYRLVRIDNSDGIFDEDIWE